LRVDLLLGVAREEHVARAEVQLEDDRRVIDVLAGLRRIARHLAGERPIDIETRAVQEKAIADGDDPCGTTLGRQLGPVSGVAGTGAEHPVLDHLADLVSRQE
jgi:hypothetical protein